MTLLASGTSAPSTSPPEGFSSSQDVPALSLQQGQIPWQQLRDPPGWSQHQSPQSLPFQPISQSRAAPPAIPACSSSSAFPVGRALIPASSPNNDPSVLCSCLWQSRNEQLPARGVGIRAEGWKQPLIISQSLFFIYFPPQRLLQEFSIPVVLLQTPGFTRTTPNVVYLGFFLHPVNQPL